MHTDRSTRGFDLARRLFFFVLLAMICPSPKAFAEAKTVTDADKGSEVHLKAGDTLEVRLRSNPTTGFMWYVHSKSTPLMKLASQSQTEAKDQSTEPGVGRPIFQIFNFVPRRSGDGVLLLHYVRSWDTPSPDEEQFSLHVVIE
jgi:inhibitor of cysteine peptidase